MLVSGKAEIGSLKILEIDSVTKRVELLVFVLDSVAIHYLMKNPSHFFEGFASVRFFKIFTMESLILAQDER